MEWAAYILLGFGVGALGTLVGAGGGFLLVPLLVLLNPGATPEAMTSISLTAVFFNALSGTLGYLKQRRVDLRSGLIFAAATVPGSLLGVLANSVLPRAGFQMMLAAVLLALSALLFLVPPRSRGVVDEPDLPRFRVWCFRRTPHVKHPYMLGIVIAFVVGFVSTLLGIGGGIIHVPVLAYVLFFPVHIATATSTFVLMVSSAVGASAHVATGGLSGAWGMALALSAGVIAGAQVGAGLAPRIPARVLLRILACLLLLAGGRLLWVAL